MPKGFSDHERERIHAQLLVKGQMLFGTFGLKKTSVENITNAVGISKGAFYIFYQSKEELFLNILEQFEADFQQSILREVTQQNVHPKQRFRQMLQKALELRKTNLFFSHFGQEEYEALVRKLPEEKIQQMLQNDEIFADKLIAAWKNEGIMINSEPKLFANILRALFVINFHETDFDQDVFPEMLEWFLDLTLDRLMS
ncbi:MAG: hypothetical protein GFH23_1086674n86 [Chloroflexi bacterium AL-N1]|nr:hypothetical protein [Chloroflexi bacterium AL-N1]NOK92193.1 hypothetical protein [Chloroflexi bacterium AL-N15]